MNNDFYIIKLIFISEGIAIVGTAMLCLICRRCLTLLRKYKAHRHSKLYNYLKTAIEKEHDVKRLPLRFVSIKSILIVFKRLDEHYSKSSPWIALRESLAKSYIIPRKKSHIKSRAWENRSLAVRICSMFPDNTTDSDIINLLHDPIPLVRMQAARCAVNRGNKLCVDAIITALRNEDRFSSYIFRDALASAEKKTRNFIYQRYMKDNDSLVKTHCLSTLLQFDVGHLSFELYKDLNSTDMELRIAAMKMMGKVKPPHATDHLIALLKDPKWEIRSCATSCLGTMQDSNALLPLSKALKDKVWWVRMNSGMALRNLGDGGIRLLRRENAEKDKFAYDVSQYVLSLPTRA